MTSTYTLNQGIEKPAAGDQSGTWGATVNTNMDIIDRVVSGVGALTLTGSTTTLTTTDGTLSDGMYRVLVLGDSGDLGSDNTITLSPNDADKLYLVYNNLTANRNAIFSQGSGANATVENGETAWIYADGAGGGAAVRVATSSTKLLDQDGDTGIRVEEGGDDDDTIRFDIAGAEDFTISANTLTALSGSTIATNTIAETTGASGVTIDGLLIKDSTAAFADGAVATPSITNTGDLNTGIYFPAADTVGVTAGGTEQFRFGSNPIPGGGKNLVINGAMNVSQRGVNAVILAGFDSTTNTYGPDKFLMSGNGSPQNRGEVEHVSSGGPTGFPSFFRYDITTAESAVAAGEATVMQQRIEGYITNRLSWGNAAAKAVTLSFYMRSPKSGTHCVSLGQSGGRHYLQEFTVDAADTWEKHELTFPGDTSGSMNVAGTEGLRIIWPIIAGSTYQGSGDSWIGASDWATSNQQNLADSTSNNIDLTGVQLEIGSVATDFEFEDIGTTLAKCQRYFYATNLYEQQTRFIVGAYDATNALSGRVTYPVQMRAAPTAAFTSSAFRSFHEGSVFDSSITIGITPDQFGYQPFISAQSSGTQGEVYFIGDNSGDATTGLITFTADY